MSLENNFTIQDNHIKFIKDNKEVTISFKFPIDKVIPFEECLVVSIEPSVDQIFNENVFGISNKGEIIWQIEEIPHIYDKSPYTGMGRVGDTVKLCNWDGTDLIVEPYTGKIIKKSYSR